jgi:hypothetical protein
VNHQFDTPGRVEVRVDNKVGTVRLQAHTGTATRVEVTAPGVSDVELVERTKVEHHLRDGAHVVVVEVPSPPASSGVSGSVRIYGRHRAQVVVTGPGELLRPSVLDGAAVLVTVHVPEGAEPEVVTTSGDIVLEGNLGSAAIRTSSGDVSVERVLGTLEARSVSGNVTVSAVTREATIVTVSGEVWCGTLGGASRVQTASGHVTVESAPALVNVQTASGDVHAGDLAGGCRIRTASGDVRVARLVAGRAQLDTVNGDLTVGVARSTVVAVDAESVSGDLSSEIELGTDEAAGAQWDGAGEARAELRARTVSGDLRIERAPAY